MKETSALILAVSWSLSFLLASCGKPSLLEQVLFTGNATPTPTATPSAAKPEYLFVADGQTVRSFSVSGGARTETGSAMAPGMPATYTRSGTTVTITQHKHELRDNLIIYLDFSAGTGGTATDGAYAVTTIDADTFRITDTASGTITGGKLLRKFSHTLTGTYAQSGTTVTVTINGHGLMNNDSIALDYTSGTAADANVKISSIIDANTFTVTAAASATTSGNVSVTYGKNHGIFDVALHPSGKWIYTVAGYDAYASAPFNWGGDIISRFAINWSTGALTHEETVRASQSATDGDTDTDDPVPVALSFNADGTRLVNQDDDLDGLRLWSVNTTTGAITRLATSAGDTTNMHGVTFSADGTRVYNGDSVFTITSGPDAITLTRPGVGGQGSKIVNGTLFLVDENNWTITSYNLTNPDSPVAIATRATQTENKTRDLAISSNGMRVIGSGFLGLQSYTYDGTAFTPVSLYRDGSSWTGSANQRMFRTVTLNSEGTIAASAYFTNASNAGQGGVPPSGVILLNVASDGTLSLANDYNDGYYARVARFFQQP